jgi:phosphoribosyl-dephospho-CoA transferase
MKHYVVVLNWATEGDNGSNVLGVAHTLEEAKEIFDETFKEEKDLAENNGWKIYEESDKVFDAGEDGYYHDNYTKLYIQEV